MNSTVFYLVALEYTYITAPMNMQGLMTGDINCTRLDYYFYGLSVLLAIYSVVFVIISKSCNLQIGRIRQTRELISN